MCAFTPIFGQEDYLKLRNEIDVWSGSCSSPPLDDYPKVIEYPEYGYLVIGSFKKGVLQEGSPVCIRSKEGGFKLSGIVTGASMVKGIKEEAEDICTYGIFKIANSSDGVFTSKVKKAGKLQITDARIEYYKGYYNDCPAILSVRNKCIAVDGKTGGRNFIGLHCPVKEIDITSIGYRNLKELLLTVSGGCRIEFDGGYKFTGKLQPILQENGYIAFLHLEGEETNPTDALAKVSVKREGSFVSMFSLYQPGSNVVSEEIIVPSSFISDENLWNTEMYYQNASEVRCKFTDNSSYKGKIKIVDSDDSTGCLSMITLTEGIYTFGNGDSFTGNLSGRYYGGLPIDGIVSFADGTQASGNWLSKYDLTQSQLDSLKSRKYPPTEIRKQAEKYQFSNHYIKYGPVYVSVFSPDKEKCVNFSDWSNDYSYLLYDKKTERFAGIDEYKGEEIIDFEFIVDDYGRHIEEIVYEDNIPKYKNKLTWYSNGILQSIKSYHYDTNEIYLVINFFSDGSLKNAYEYAKGNFGKNILRRSKEAHPTFGGFLTRLYDLDGNYEKTIEWYIGRWQLVPDALKLNGLKQIK